MSRDLKTPIEKATEAFRLFRAIIYKKLTFIDMAEIRILERKEQKKARTE